MTPIPANHFPWGAVPETAWPALRVGVASLLHEVGRPLARTARTVRSGKLGMTGLRTLLTSDFFGPAGGDDVVHSDSPSARFASLLQPLLQIWPGLADEPHLRGVMAQLQSLEQLHAAVLRHEEAATAQAMGIALSIERLLQECLDELDAQRAQASLRR